MRGARKAWNSLGAMLAILLSAWFLSDVRPFPQAAPAVRASAENTTTPDAGLLETADTLPRRAELLERMGVRAWHARGWRGRGLKVAVLDSGFRGYRTHLGAALPQTVKNRSFRFDGNLEAKDSQHGILCAEVIHVLAPEAELLFANWEPEHPEQFLAAVRWARQEGAQILSCSIIMPTWSDGAGHGRIHEELARLLGPADRAGGALFFASAGNTAQRHWSGSFHDDGDGFHVWKQAEGVAVTENAIHPWGSERVSVELCCPAGAGYEVLVTDTMTRQLVGRTCSADSGGINSAVVAFLPEPDHDYHVRVRQVSPPSPPRLGGEKKGGEFHLVVLGGGLEYSRCQASIPFPGDGAEIIAVGAVNAAGRRMSYSSCGPEQGGTKPEFVATVPFPSSWRPRPFAGTSAAAPQAAALAALVWSRHAHWKPQQVRDALRNAARPGPRGGPAWEIGRGLIHLPLASVATLDPARVIP